MRRALGHDTRTGNLDEEGEAEETDQRQKLGTTAMVPTRITQILEDTSPFRSSFWPAAEA